MLQSSLKMTGGENLQLNFIKSQKRAYLYSLSFLAYFYLYSVT